jgi:hypothetical protein
MSSATDNKESPKLSEITLTKYFKGSLIGVADNRKTVLEATFQILGLTSGVRICMPTICNPIILKSALDFGLEPVFIDSDQLTWNLCPKFLHDALTKSHPQVLPKAVLVSHMLGMPAQINKIIDIAKRFHVPVIEDASQALGSYTNMNQCGTVAEVALVKMPLAVQQKECFGLISQNSKFILPASLDNFEAEIETEKQLVSQIQFSRKRHDLLKSALAKLQKLEILDEMDESFSNKEVFAALLPKGVATEDLLAHCHGFDNLIQRFPSPNHLKYPEKEYNGDGFSSAIYNRGFYIELLHQNEQDLEKFVSFMKGFISNC